MDREMDQMAEVHERLVLVPWAQTLIHQFKVPQYTVSRDVEYFISWFQEVAQGNTSTEEVRLLHLIEALKEEAENYRQVVCIRTVFHTMRVRFDFLLK